MTGAGPREPVSFLVFSASLRSGSLNTRLALLAAVVIGAHGGEADVASMRDFDAPSYDADVQDNEGFPAGADRFRTRLAACDGFVVCAPEYNASMPGTLKNAVDWASRPPRDAALDRKPVGIIGASPGQTGSARGQSQLRQAFEFTNSYCMPQPEILVFRAHEEFDDDGRLSDGTTARYLTAYLEAFAAWVERFKG